MATDPPNDPGPDSPEPTVPPAEPPPAGPDIDQPAPVGEPNPGDLQPPMQA